MKENDILIKVEGLWKKYCRNLKTSLYYAIKDIGKEMLCFHNAGQQLRNKEFWSLQDISLELKRGETLGIVGHNGAGKSTLLKLLNGIIKPTRGRIAVNGSMQALIELGGAFSPLLTGRENIFVSAAILGIRKKELVPKLDEIIEFAGLQDFIDSPVATYSTGMKVRLGFSVATVIQPEILVLDEVLSVGDIAFQMKSLDKVAQIREKAGGVVFVSHNVNQLRRLCTKCLLLDHGRMVLYGEPGEVIDAYIKSQNLNIIKGKMASQAGIVQAEGIDLIDWGIEQRGVQAAGSEISRGPFLIWYRVRLYKKFGDLGLDIVLMSEALQPLISKTFHCPDLENVTGDYVISIELPDLNLASRQYFPYIAVIDQKTLKKIIRFQDQIGFSIKGKAHSPGVLDPQLNISIRKGHGSQGGLYTPESRPR